jgi:hypothetical protein
MLKKKTYIFSEINETELNNIISNNKFKIFYKKKKKQVQQIVKYILKFYKSADF